MCPDSDDKFSWPEIVRGQFLDGLCTSGLVGHHLVTRTRTLSITMDNRGMMMTNRGLSKKPGAGRHQPWPWVQARVASSKAKASFSRGDTDQHTANNDSSTRRLVDSSTGTETAERAAVSCLEANFSRIRAPWLCTRRTTPTSWRWWRSRSPRRTRSPSLGQGTCNAVSQSRRHDTTTPFPSSHCPPPTPTHPHAAASSGGRWI